MPSRGYPPCETIEQLIAHLCTRRDDEMEVHTKPMSAQLKGLWQPADDELITMEAFFNNPPYGIRKPQIHHHKSPYRPPILVDELTKYMFYKKYHDDVCLFLRAEKSPLTTGGNNGDRRRP